MPTPAEIIAARHNNDNQPPASASSNDDSYFSDNEEFNDVTTAATTSSTGRSTPNIADESAFPALGGGKKSTSTTPILGSWGPTMKSPVSSSNPTTSKQHATPALKSKSSTPTGSSSTNGNGKSKTSTVQEAFSLDADDQSNVSKPDFFKILNNVKLETNTTIECTTSQHTKKRTFLITGKVGDVTLAKRLVIRQLTKPVKITFSVPAKLRSRIIGPQGSTLKPIIQTYDVKVDIGNLENEDAEEDNDNDEDDDEDDLSKVIKITIEGDVEGSKSAKAQILAIVNEETKNLVSKVKLDDTVKPFAQNSLSKIVAKYSNLDISIPDYKSASSTLLISGARDSVIESKAEIKSVLDSLSSKIITEEVAIPVLKHRFLPIDKILQEHNVLIKLPTDDSNTNVKFVGEKAQISLAKESARQTSSQFKIEILDMSKAHKGNLKHVKAVAALLDKNGVFAEISKENDITIQVPDIKALSDNSIVSIPIELVTKNTDTEKTLSARKAIVQKVNKITPDQTKVIEDIDVFLLPKVSETIDTVAKEHNISYIILGNSITLFTEAKPEPAADDFDFVESTEDDDSSVGLTKVNEALNKLRELSSTLESVVLSVPSKDQSQISGVRGTTLKSILSDVEPNSVIVKLHSNGLDSKSDDEVYIHGIKTEVKKVKHEIETVLADAIEHKDGYSSILEVPSHILSRLIGKNGANLNSLRDEHGVKIDVSDDGKPDHKDEEIKDKTLKTSLIIAGIKRNVEQSKAEIQALAKRWADETTVRLKIENQYHRKLIGQNGIYSNRLQDKYNVKIRFPHLASDKSTGNGNGNVSSDAPKGKDEVTIRGASKNVAKAQEELLELYNYEKENGFQQLVQIPTKAIARVIGKAGETINDIAADTGIEYKFKRDNESEEKTGFAEVELTGSRTALKQASKKISEIIEEIENFVTVKINVDPKYHRDLIGQGGSVMKQIIAKAGGEDLPRNKYFKLLNIPNEGTGSDEVTSQGDKSIVDKIVAEIKKIIGQKESEVSFDYELSKEKHRLVVGSNGSIRHALQDEFGVSIDIPRPNDSSSIIKLSGLPEKIDALKVKLDELTKDDWNESIDIPAKYHALVSEKGAIFKKLRSDYNVEVQHGTLTRQAAKLSNTSIPTPPETAFPTEEVTTLFTIVPNSEEEATTEETIIPWRLKGDVKNTAKVAELIEKRLKLAEEANSTGWYYAKDPSTFSKVVGPQGSKINQIRKKTNTFITVPRSTDKHSNFIYVVGSEDNLNAAKKEIEIALK
ncbi:vigilin [Scheffersomyces coipomensis]|uniref:vigilin n=1 Tax=Scheffersomyces coipomensis TaxID=1788519 RepID=UPI00315D8463